jgi:hypothetical protein
MEVIRSSETSVNTISTRRHIPEDCFLHSHRRENLKSYNIKDNCEKKLRFKRFWLNVRNVTALGLTLSKNFLIRQEQPCYPEIAHDKKWMNLLNFVQFSGKQPSPKPIPIPSNCLIMSPQISKTISCRYYFSTEFSKTGSPPPLSQ